MTDLFGSNVAIVIQEKQNPCRKLAFYVIIIIIFNLPIDLKYPPAWASFHFGNLLCQISLLGELVWVHDE